MSEIAGRAKEDLLGLVHGKIGDAASRPWTVLSGNEARADQADSARSAFAVVHGGEDRNTLGQPRKLPAEQPGGGHVRERCPVRQDQQPCAQVAKELVVGRECRPLRDEEPVTHASEPSQSDLTPDRPALGSHATRLQQSAVRSGSSLTGLWTRRLGSCLVHAVWSQTAPKMGHRLRFGTKPQPRQRITRSCLTRRVHPPAWCRRGCRQGRSRPNRSSRREPQLRPRVRAVGLPAAPRGVPA